MLHRDCSFSRAFYLHNLRKWKFRCNRSALPIPGTVQKAYKILEDEGITSTEHTSKSIVCADEASIKKIKTELARESVTAFIDAMKEMNINEKEAAELLHTVWRDKE